MSVKLLTEHHLEFLCLKGGCTGSSKSTHVKMPHCWKSHVTAHICFYSSAKLENFDNILIFFCEFYTKLVSVHTENKVRMLYTVVGATMVIINSPHFWSIFRGPWKTASDVRTTDADVTLPAHVPWYPVNAIPTYGYVKINSYRVPEWDSEKIPAVGTRTVIFMLTPYAFFRSWHHFLFLHNIEKNHEKYKLGFEYIWKYFWKWSICSKRANAPFSIIFSTTWYFKGVKRRYYGVKG